ncbi:hypothetical protein EW145_g4012 [Phellinidium pouzarii]|uniref:Uncharacterized protein n=1 Tax=Phellinidium pouzarii TaxID=167371 RepID=A0A4S4L5A4_9AGAM|nr:hypothetical protein EW145_g4012 [Phellinidium pouzarii]
MPPARGRRRKPRCSMLSRGESIINFEVTENEFSPSFSPLNPDTRTLVKPKVAYKLLPETMTREDKISQEARELWNNLSNEAREHFILILKEYKKQAEKDYDNHTVERAPIVPSSTYTDPIVSSLSLPVYIPISSHLIIPEANPCTIPEFGFMTSPLERHSQTVYYPMSVSLGPNAYDYNSPPMVYGNTFQAGIHSNQITTDFGQSQYQYNNNDSNHFPALAPVPIASVGTSFTGSNAFTETVTDWMLTTVTPNLNFTAQRSTFSQGPV